MEAKDQHEKVYIERAKAKSIKNKVIASFTMGRMDSDQDKARNKDEGAAQSDDSMMVDIEAGGGSDFEVLESDELPPPKTTARGKKTAKKAPAKAPAKKAPAKGRGKKAVEVRMSAMDPAVSSSSNLG